MKLLKSKNLTSSRIWLVVVPLLFILFFIPKTSSAQFGYVGAGIDYTSTVFSNNYYNKTTNNILTFDLGAHYRPLKWLSVGCSYSIPIVQTLKYSFDSDTTEFGYYDFDPEYTNPRYLPQVFDYDISYSNTLTAFGRLYYTESLYFEVSISSLTITEKFQFSRDTVEALYETDPEEYDYGELQETAVDMVNIDISEEHKMMLPGFKLGATLDLSDNIYFDMWGGVRVLKFGTPSFTESVSFDWSKYEDITDYVVLQSHLKDTKVSMSFGFRVGYRF